MEVFSTENHYIFVRSGDKSLWWNRRTSEFTIKKDWDLSSVFEIDCLGITYGVLGVIDLPGVYDGHLVIIRDVEPVGVLYAPNLVYKIKSICILSDAEPNCTLIPCKKHASKSMNVGTGNAKPKMFESSLFASKTMGKTWDVMKSAGTSIKNTTQSAAKSTTVKLGLKEKDPNMEEKKINEEIHKIFDDTNSFYFCFASDITNNLQRRCAGNEFDDRFFWNKNMLKEIIELNDPDFILPVIQGFVEVEQCVVDNESLTLALISRRSRYRAGTRYKRRGVDDDGHCANYVETEQILTFRQHQISFTQIRGSVPIYWSQGSVKYRPPPRLDRDEAETQKAFEKHFNEELALYSKVGIINLVEQNGKERVIGDAYANHVMKLNNEDIFYVTFDFHEYCRGMCFEKVSVLIEALATEAGSMGFHWSDRNGKICDQNAVFRINCIDCLDRTNVVQTAIGRTVLESQLVKLGLTVPYAQIPEQIKMTFMMLWANNGDVLSQQYAGTKALKGDFTRTGERKISGMFKDGMNSANRYILAHFKDTYRQAVIDLVLGNHAESLAAFKQGSNPSIADEAAEAVAVDHARMLVDDCRKLLLGHSEFPIGAWGLINADPVSGDPDETEIDCVLILTNELYIYADYSAELDKITRFEKVPLEEIYSIEFGTYQQSKMFSGSSKPHLCLCINYCIGDVAGFFHMFRSPNIRFFNNLAIPIEKDEEVHESLNTIVELFKIALMNIEKNDVHFMCGGNLQRRKSRSALLNVPSGMPRNLSESQLVQIGSKAFSNVAGQFSKLGQSLNRNNNDKDNKAASKTKAIDDPSFQSYVKDDNNLLPDQDGALPNPFYNENSFLPHSFHSSVGIVMSQTDCEPFNQSNVEAAAEAEAVNQNNSNKQALDVTSMSISSVIDNVKMPGSMLCNPDITVTDKEGQAAGDGGQSSSNSPSKESGPSEVTGATAMKQLKNLTNPLSKFGKYVQQVKSPIAEGIAIMDAKVHHQQASPNKSVLNYESPTERLKQKWTSSDCKSKLIAL